LQAASTTAQDTVPAAVLKKEEILNSLPSPVKMSPSSFDISEDDDFSDLSFLPSIGSDDLV
jgi:hypothetical protein